MDTLPSSESSAERRRVFATQVRNHYGLLLRYARRRIRYYRALGMLAPGEMSPEDLVNQATMTALRRLPEKRDDIGFFPWFRRIADTVLRRFAQHAVQRRQRVVSVEQPVGATEDGEPIRLLDILPDPGSQTPHIAVEQQELERILNAALDRLPDEWRECFLMATLDGMTAPEIALLEGRSVEEIRRSVRLARDYLRESLDAESNVIGKPKWAA